MRVAHFAPFAPHSCGLYEAARDFVHADRLSGRSSELCDIGVNGGQPEPGKIDDRGDAIVSRSWEEVRDSDVFVVHGGIPDSWLAQTTAPVVLAMHGRPLACFRPEQQGTGNSFSFLTKLSLWPRVRKVMTMWSEHVPSWELFVPQDKLTCTDDPPIDCDYFCPNPKDVFKLPKDKHMWGTRNILIADSWREDVDCFEAAAGALQAVRYEKGLKIHFWGVESKDGKPLGAWEEIFSRLRNAGALGYVYGRMPHMEVVYRAFDAVLCPHRIAVRVMGEALASGTPVIAEHGCRYTSYTAQFNDPVSIRVAIGRLFRDLNKNENVVRGAARHTAHAHFSLELFGQKLGNIYEGAIRG